MLIYALQNILGHARKEWHISVSRGIYYWVSTSIFYQGSANWFRTKQNYETLLQENQGRQSRIEETTKLIAFKEEQLAALDLQYKEAVGNLTLTSNQLEETLEELADKRNALTEALRELKDIKQLLKEQVMLTNAHSTTEERLHRLAGGLVGTLKTSVADISNLHSTLGKINPWN